MGIKSCQNRPLKATQNLHTYFLFSAFYKAMDWSCAQSLVVSNRPNALISILNNIQVDWMHQLPRQHNRNEHMFERQPLTSKRVHISPTNRTIEMNVLLVVIPKRVYHAAIQWHQYKSIGVEHIRCRFQDRSNLQQKINWSMWHQIVKTSVNLTQLIDIGQYFFTPFLWTCVQHKFMCRYCFIAQSNRNIRIDFASVQCCDSHRQTRYKTTKFT